MIRKKPSLVLNKTLGIASTIGMFAVTYIILRWAHNTSLTENQAQNILSEKQGKYESLSLRHESLMQRNQDLSTTVGQRDFLINKHALHRPGERVLILIEDDTKAKPSVQAVEKKWWQRFFGD